MSNPLRIILRGGPKKVKSQLTNPNPEFKIVFKKGEIDLIKQIKGWKSDAEMGRALGVTKAYISMMRHEKASVTHTVITRLAYLLGNLDGKWWTHYKIVRWVGVDDRHPLFNYEKYKGRIPYIDGSPIAEMRGQDYPVEKKKRRIT